MKRKHHAGRDLAHQIITDHATRCLKSNFCIHNLRKRGHCWQAVIVRATTDTVEYYEAWTDYGAVGMTKTRSRPLAELPLFAE